MLFYLMILSVFFAASNHIKVKALKSIVGMIQSLYIGLDIYVVVGCETMFDRTNARRIMFASATIMHRTKNDVFFILVLVLLI